MGDSILSEKREVKSEKCHPDGTLNFSLLIPHFLLFILLPSPFGEGSGVRLLLFTSHFVLFVVDEPAEAEADAKLIVILVEVNHSKQVEEDLLV